ncbi:MAG: hypothetical protein ACYTJ0_09950 [Planctomycetota bacterium]|jgi:hypothetical protein
MRATIEPTAPDAAPRQEMSAVDVLTVAVVLATMLALGVLCRSAQAYGAPPDARAPAVVDR